MKIIPFAGGARIYGMPEAELGRWFDVIRHRMKWAEHGFVPAVKYIDLGVKTVRLVVHSPEFMPHIERQLAFSLKDEAVGYDATLEVWKDANLVVPIGYFAPGCGYISVHESETDQAPVICMSASENKLEAYDRKENTYYYSIGDLAPEEFIKQGHIFVQTLSKVLKTPTSALVHGAVVGTKGNGILFCARGQRGKSTLTVNSLLHGFDYVSDDYLVLSNEADGLYSYPIYSIVTLSPRMYNELGEKLKSRFISNNARKDKYVLSIRDYHGQFKARERVKVCMFPQICDIKEPSIEKMPERGRAVTQLVHSTIAQMGDLKDTSQVMKLISFVKDLEFYQINLSPDIEANVACLKSFAEKL